MLKINVVSWVSEYAHNLNHTVNVVQILNTYLYEYCPATGMQSSVEPPTNIISADPGL